MLEYARLTIEADVDGDGTDETGIFELYGDLDTTSGVRTDWTVDGALGTVNSVISGLADDGEDKRQGFYGDLGSGSHFVQIDCSSWEDATKADGSPLQWGDDPEPGRSATSATGADALTQLHVLERYLTVGETDSRNPATLEYGEFSQSGLYDPLGVVLEEPQLTRNHSEETSSFSLSLTCIAAADLREAWDAVQRLPY